MCGILGYIGSNDLLSVDQFSNILSFLSHRGPDSMGIHIDEKFVFGHTRLSIIDLSDASNQPMKDSSEMVFITFNGEIFNYKELQEELMDLGIKFNTHSDTEVILESYKQWGISFISKLDGMFAFAIYDKRYNLFYLVRDRLGVKPVYYSIINNCLVFCSELKGIVNFPNFKKQIDIHSISSFLSFRQPLPGKTFFKNVFILKPAHYLIFNDKGICLKNYWEFTLKENCFLNKSKSSQEKVAGLIHKAVQSALVADVEIGVFLSGGIDSSVILYEMSKCVNYKPKSYTVWFKESGYDESYYADLISRQCNSNNIKIKISKKDYISNIKNLIKYKDQPLAMHNEVALYLMSKEVVKYTKVALSGEGSDELFGGYGRIFRLYVDLYRRRLVKFLPKFIQTKVLTRLGLKKEHLYMSDVKFFLTQYEYFPKEEKYQIFNNNVKKVLKEDKFIVKFIEDIFYNRYKNLSFRNKVLAFFETFHLHGLLTMMDSASMAASLEVRFPFLQHELIDVVAGLPFRFKLKWISLKTFFKAIFMPIGKFSEECDVTKFFLKKIYRNQIPDEIIDRKKMVFPVPLTEWLGKDYNQFIQAELLGDLSKSSLLFDLKKLRKWINKKEKGDDKLYGRKIWLLLNLEYWLREYFPKTKTFGE